jgi:hypothetical protein
VSCLHDLAHTRVEVGVNVSILAALSAFGTNSGAVWMFAGGVLVCLLAAVLVCMGVAFIRRLLDAAGGPRS